MPPSGYCARFGYSVESEGAYVEASLNQSAEYEFACEGEVEVNPILPVTAPLAFEITSNDFQVCPNEVVEKHIMTSIVNAMDKTALRPPFTVWVAVKLIF